MARGSELFFYVDKNHTQKKGLGGVVDWLIEGTNAKTERINSAIITEGFEVAHCGLNEEISELRNILLGVGAVIGTLVELGIVGASLGSVLGPVGAVIGVVTAVLYGLLISGVFGEESSAWDEDRTKKTHNGMSEYYINNVRVIGLQKPTNKVDDDKIFATLNKALLECAYMERVFNQAKNTRWKSSVSKTNTANLHKMTEDIIGGIMKKINSMSFFYDIEKKDIEVKLDTDLINKLNQAIDIKKLNAEDEAKGFFDENKVLTFSMFIAQRKPEYVNGVAIFEDFLNADKNEARKFIKGYKEKKEFLLESGRKINELMLPSGLLTKEQIEDLVRWKQATAENGKIETPKEKEPEKLNPKNPANTGASAPTIKEKEPEKPKELIKPQIIEEKKTEPVKRQNHTKKLFLGLLLLLILKQNKKDGNT